MNADDVQLFLETTFDGKPDEAWLLIWSLPDRVSRWCRTPSDAVKQVTPLTAHDVYVGVALSERDRGPRVRGTADEVAGIVGLWADVDIADDAAHRKANLPPDEASARHVVKSTGAEPTILVHSGHGLQAWWLFAEPWMFDSADERNEAARLALRWGATMRLRAAENGWVIDATHDLTRVMRVPGTVNHKGEPVEARILECAPKVRYQPSDFDEWLADESALTLLTGRRTYHIDSRTLELRPNASPDAVKLDALRSNHKQFEATWNRTRRDLADQSPSSYDMSLAAIASRAGWTDQEIVDLIIANRRKHGDDLKLRPDYYARTIARARDETNRERSFEALELNIERVERVTLAEQVSTGADGGTNSGGTVPADTAREAQYARRQLLQDISTYLTVEVVRIEKLLSDPVRWKLITPVKPNGEVLIGTTADLLNQQTVRAAVAAATRNLMPRFKAKEWDQVVQAMLRAAEECEVGDEATDAGLARSWLSDYLQDRPLVTDQAESAEAGAPFRHADGTVMIYGPALKRWLWLSRGEKVSPQRLGDVLRAFGCEHQRVYYTKSTGNRSVASGWRLPEVFAASL